MSPGEAVGPYTLGPRIGSGGMGEVFRATDPRLGRDVAIKFLRAGAERDPERLRRFENEARAAAQLNHPNILAVLDVGTHAGAPYLVTELLEGETLRERLARAVTAAQARELALQIANGLRAAHAHAIVHRDLKPENVFVTSDGRVKILDFGIARFAESGESGPVKATQTATGTLLGTAGYMAPEQVRGQPADARADVFAFGCILYELLGGKRAFDRATSVETGYAILNADPPPLPAGTPRALAQLVRRCLEKEVEKRVQSTDEVIAALSTETVAAPATSRAPLALGGLLVAAAVAIVAVMNRQPPPQAAAIAEMPDAGHRGVGMMDLPLPASSNPAALAAYRRALQELHDGSVAEAAALLNEAHRLDPQLGAAMVRSCLWIASVYCPEAQQLRSTLSPRDQALLDAASPWLNPFEAYDRDAGLAREAALLHRFPDDAEIVLIAGRLHGLESASGLAEARALAQHALELDPTFAGAWWMIGDLMSPEVDDSQRALEQCLALAPQAGGCLRALATLRAVEGDCEGFAQYVLRMKDVQPSGAYLHAWLMDARIANGATREEIESMFEKWPELRDGTPEFMATGRQLDSRTA
jgi:hypothetical protein